MQLLANFGMPDQIYETNFSKYFPLLTLCNHVKQVATEWTTPKIKEALWACLGMSDHI